MSTHIALDEPQDELQNAGINIFGDLIMVALSLISVGLLIFDVVADLSVHQSKALEYTDLTIAFIFFAEFSIRCAKAENKKQFLRSYWWELLASIPITSQTTQLLRGLRVIRIFRLIRLLRMIRFVVRLKVILENSAKLAEQTYLIYISTISALVIMSSSLGFYYIEAGKNPNVHGLYDCIWWAVVTITTVGYGDIYSCHRWWASTRYLSHAGRNCNLKRNNSQYCCLLDK